MKRHLILIMIAAGLLVGVLVGLLLFRPALFGLASSPAPPRDLSKAVAGTEPAHSRGADLAPVTLEEFADFQCPPCRALYPELKMILAEYGPRVRLLFRHYPLPTHEHAAQAALAAEAAGAQGRFWEMHDLLYERQREWSAAPDVRSLFIGYACSLGLDMERFTREMDAAQTRARVEADRLRGDSINLEGTPTLFINDREVPTEAMSAEGIRAALNNALKAKGL